MSPDTIAVGVFTILGTIGGALVGLFAKRLVRSIGRVQCVMGGGDWYVQEGAATPSLS